MSHGFWAVRSGLTVLIAALATVPASGQAPKAYTPPRTPWGDPDMQGWFTNLSEEGTLPLERPESIRVGRKLEDIKGEELATIKKNIQNRTIETFKAPLNAPDTLVAGRSQLGERGTQAWLIVDPPDGKIPARPPPADARAAARAAARRNSGRGPADSWTDRSLYDQRASRARTSRLDDAGDLRQLVSIHPGSRIRRDPLRDDPRDPPGFHWLRLEDRNPRTSPRAFAPTWATRADTGRAMRWWSRPPMSARMARIETPMPRPSAWWNGSSAWLRRRCGGQ